MTIAKTGAAAALILAGCAPQVAPTSGDPAHGAPIMAGLKWDAVVTGAGVGLTLSQADGSALMRLACVRGPATMTVRVEPFRAIGSEERLTLGLGGEAYTFVADPSDRRAGVGASGPISEDLLTRLPDAVDVSANYGAQRLGPYMPPDPEFARLFVAGCRAAMRS